MGTNYYLHQKACPHCGHEETPLHIGKGSVGWCFALHVTPDEGIHDLKDWAQLWCKPGAVIVDEYGRVVSPESMAEIITDRRWEERAYTANFLARNHAELGPNGLLRCRLDAGCIAHGNGTWDCIVEDFS